MCCVEMLAVQIALAALRVAAEALRVCVALSVWITSEKDSRPPAEESLLMLSDSIGALRSQLTPYVGHMAHSVPPSPHHHHDKGETTLNMRRVRRR